MTGAFISSKVLGSEVAKSTKGVRANIASDLSAIEPDKWLFEKVWIQSNRQRVKTVVYVDIKSGIIGLTKCLATYWHNSGVRVNALSQGCVIENQDVEFVGKLTEHISLS